MAEVPRLPPLILGARTFDGRCGTLRILTDLKASEYGDVWQAGHTLASYLEEVPSWVKGKKVIELGAGVGYVGLTCALLGASKVVLTDQQPLLPVLLANVQDNVHVVEHASVAALDWGIPSEREAMARQNFQVVVASDVIYEEQNIDPFIRTLGAIWDSSSTVALTVHCILALKKRDLAAEVLEQFFARLEVAGFTANEVKPTGCSSNFRSLNPHDPNYWSMCLKYEISLHVITRA